MLLYDKTIKSVDEQVYLTDEKLKKLYLINNL